MEIQDLELLEDRVNRVLELVGNLRGEKGRLEEKIEKLETENSILKQTKEEARKRIRDLLKRLNLLSH